MKIEPRILKSLSPGFRGLTPDGAKAILRVKLKEADIQHIHALSSLAKEGTLSDEGRGELEFYLQIGHVLTLLHSQARMALKPLEIRKRRKSA